MANFNHLNDDELMDIEGEVFENAGIDFAAILEESDDSDSDYISDQSENQEDLDENIEDPNENIENLDEDIEYPRESLVNKIVLASEIFAQNVQCAIYSYYIIGNNYVACADCMPRSINQNDEDNDELMSVTRKHVTAPYDALDGKYCSGCRAPVFIIFQCNMCPICAH